jgi:CheY-like chemotaxis protein
MGIVLIVDDHPSVAGSLVRLLGASGFDAQAVQTGAEALAFVRSQPVALVLLDLSLPDMSGVEVLRALHAPGGHPNPPPVVMFSADDEQSLRDEATRLGAIGFVSKNNPDVLLPLVQAHVPPTPRA